MSLVCEGVGVGREEGESLWGCDCVWASFGVYGGETGEYVDGGVGEERGEGGGYEHVCGDGDGDGGCLGEGVVGMSLYFWVEGGV